MSENIEKVRIIGDKSYRLSDIATKEGLTSEIARAKAAEEELEVQIADEAARATAADRANAEAVIAEKERAEAALTNEINKLKDGDTIVGQAREIHSRNGKNDSANFLVRTTAGSGTIGDGVATLKSVGGNIVKNLVDGTFDSGIYVKTSNTPTRLQLAKFDIPYIVNHYYYCSAFVRAVGDSVVAISYNSMVNKTEITTSEWCHISVRNTFKKGNTPTLLVGQESSTFLAVKNLILIDLTEMFGAGKEPTQAECDKLFGTMDALPQGLSIANPNVFKSTGFNQFNPEMVLVNKAIVDGAIGDGEKTLAIIPCLPCKIGAGENNGYHIHGEFGEDIKVYLTPLNPMEVDGELYMHELAISEKGTYVPQIKGYMIVEVPTTANLCAHFLWSEDCDKNAYEPYYESVVELPKIPEMSEYGLAGIQLSGTLACDEIDLEKGVYRKKIGCVDLGSLTWIKRPETSFAGFFNAYIYPSSQTNMHGIASEKYAYAGKNYSTIASFHDSNTASDNIFSFSTTNNLIYLKATSYNDIASLQTAIRGVMLYYELAEPIEYPLPKVKNNYISSDYGVEQFDGGVPCNANNLYYMRSLAGETRNFLDRLMAGLGTTDATALADRILAVVNPVVEPANVEPETPIEE